MNRLVFPAPAFAEMVKALLRDARESCAIIFAEIIRGEETKLIYSRCEIVPDEAYAYRDSISAVLRSEYVLLLANQARQEGLSLIFAHTHPGSFGCPEFSETDSRGEDRLVQYFSARCPDSVLASLVIGNGGCRSRFMDTKTELRVMEIGATIRTLFDPELPAVEESFDRQVRAFGRQGQDSIQGLTVGIVGLGGTGSVTAQQLSYLGVRRFVLIDDDALETTNLNRVVGAMKSDVGISKVDIARREILKLNPAAEVRAVRGDIVDDKIVRLLVSSDFLFICTDSHASRAVLGQLAYQYLIPCIDMGVGIAIREGHVAFITGRVQMLAPGLPCLVCTEALNSEAIRRELMTPGQRAADPYITGFNEPQPAVISLNTVVSGLAVTMFLGAVTPIPADARFQIYDAINGSVRVLHKTPEPACIICSNSGAFLKGNSWPLPTRRN